MFSQVFYSFTRSIDKQRPYSVLPPERMVKNKQTNGQQKRGGNRRRKWKAWGKHNDEHVNTLGGLFSICALRRKTCLETVHCFFLREKNNRKPEVLWGRKKLVFKVLWTRWPPGWVINFFFFGEKEDRLSLFGNISIIILEFVKQVLQ